MSKLYLNQRPLILDNFGLDCGVTFYLLTPLRYGDIPTEEAPIVHAFLQVGDVYWGYTGESKADAKVQKEPRSGDPRKIPFPVKKVDKGNCECWDCKKILECIQKNIDKGARRTYNFFTYNCWTWATETVESCCMEVSTPGWINPAHVF